MEFNTDWLETAREKVSPIEKELLMCTQKSLMTIVLAAALFPAVLASNPALAESEGQAGEGRLRFGMEAGGGYMLAGGVSGKAMQLGTRLGWQINDALGVHYQFGMPFGGVAGYVTNPDTGAEEAAVGMAFSLNNALIGEYSINRLFRVAAGPSLDNFLGAACTESLHCIGGGGPRPGIDVRVGVTPQSRQRAGVYVNANVHTTFTQTAPFTFFALNLGRDWY